MLNRLIYWLMMFDRDDAHLLGRPEPRPSSHPHPSYGSTDAISLPSLHCSNHSHTVLTFAHSFRRYCFSHSSKQSVTSKSVATQLSGILRACIVECGSGCALSRNVGVRKQSTKQTASQKPLLRQIQSYQPLLCVFAALATPRTYLTLCCPSAGPAAMAFNKQQKQAAAMLAVFLLGCSCFASVQARVNQMSELKILAIGDSITQGSVPSKGANHPYTIQLKNILQSKYPGMNIVIDNQGGYSSAAYSCYVLGSPPALCVVGTPGQQTAEQQRQSPLLKHKAAANIHPYKAHMWT